MFVSVIFLKDVVSQESMEGASKKEQALYIFVRIVSGSDSCWTKNVLFRQQGLERDFF